MKKTLLALSALTVAVATPALAVDQSPNVYANPYNQQQGAVTYGANPYANQYGYATPAAGYQQYQPQQTAYNYPAPNNARSTTYNNYEPASGPNQSKWPYWYVGLNAGAAISGNDDWERGATGGELDNDDTFQLSATIGYKPSNFRYEAELGYADHDIGAPGATGSASATKLMGNVLYDFDMQGFSPFLGAGLGAVSAGLDPVNPAAVDGHDIKPAWQLIGGVSVNNVFPQTDLSLAYKYLDTFGDFKEDGAKFEYSAHTIEAGARLRF